MATLSVTGLDFSATEGVNTSADIATITDSDTTVTVGDLSGTISFGDGSAAVPGTITLTSPGVFDLRASHTFLEESGSATPGATFVVSISVTDAKNILTSTGSSQASVADAPLAPGNPVTPGTPVQFSGVGTGGANAAFQAFKTAIGGSDNGNVAAPQTGGFRAINWDGVKLDGTDFGGGPNTTVIANGTDVGIPLNRFQTRGVQFGAVYAVSGDGFASVNPNVAGLFPAFSPHNTFAMFNDNGIDFKFVLPSGATSAPVPAASRGFGAIFLNVELPNTSSITYFHGSTELAQIFVPVGAQSQPEFLGALFSNAIVTGVSLTLGTDVIFRFDGTTVTPGGMDDPTHGHNLVATDDFAYPEPVFVTDQSPVVSGGQGTSNAFGVFRSNAGVSQTGIVATFSDSDPNANAKDFTAQIDWGDGHHTNGAVTGNAQGGFDVTGTNTYGQAGDFPISVDVADFGGATISITNTAEVGTTNTQIVIAPPANVIVGQATVLTATVTPTLGTGAPTGFVAFVDGNGSILGIAAVTAGGQATLNVKLTPGPHAISAEYSGDHSFNQTVSAPVAATVSPDVTSFLTVTIVGQGRFRGRRATIVRLANRSMVTVPGPLYLVLDNLSRRTRLRNADGFTRNVPPLGSPFIVADLGGAQFVAPGGTATAGIVLSGFNPRRQTLTFRVLAGLSQP
jgi:hypothetical protein